MRKNHLIDRRTCLKGIGAALGLPLLETVDLNHDRLKTT